MEQEKKFLKKIITTGLLLVGGELHAQDFNHWIVVTPQEFKRRNLVTEQVDTVNMQKGDAPDIDNSKIGRIYSDRNGNTFYWINTHPVVENENTEEKSILVESKTVDFSTEISQEKKDDVDKLLVDPEIKNIIEKFNNRFKISHAWVVYKKTGEIVDIGYPEFYSGEIPESIKPLFEARILTDSVNSKNVVIYREKDEIFNSFLDRVNYSVILKNALVGFLKEQNKMNVTLKEKIDFIKPFFTTIVNDAIRELPEYEPPVWDFTLKRSTGEDYEEYIPKDVKSSDVNINNESLEEILKDENPK